MKVALIYCKIFDCDKNSFYIGGYARNMMGYPPLSLAYVAAIIRKAGHEAAIIDGNIDNLSLGEIVKRIRELSPDLLGFTVTTSSLHKVLNFIYNLKKVMNTPVIIGGALLDLYPWEVMQHNVIDYAIIGLGTNSLPTFLDNFEIKKDFFDIAGLCFRQEGKVIINNIQGGIEDINDLPFPARELLSNQRYYSPFSSKKIFSTLITSRGCLLRCIYCSLTEKLQLRKLNDVIEEMEECYCRYDIRDIDIYDAIFTIDKERVMSICQEIRRRKLGFTWTARTHINFIDKEVLEEMYASGCRMLMYGIETAEPTILKNLGRPVVSLNQIRDIITLTKRVGISPFGFFMLGNPGETVLTMENTLEASKKLGLDFAQFSKFTLIPNTKLYSEFLSSHNLDYWRNYILNNKHEFIDINTKLSSDTIMKYIKKAYINFYLRPEHIFKIAVSIKSLRQLINYIRSGFNMFFSFYFKLNQ